MSLAINRPPPVPPPSSPLLLLLAAPPRRWDGASVMWSAIACSNSFTWSTKAGLTSHFSRHFDARRRTSAIPQKCRVVATTDHAEEGTVARVLAVADDGGSDDCPTHNNKTQRAWEW